MLGICGYTFVFTSIYSSYIHFGHEVGRWALGLGVGLGRWAWALGLGVGLGRWAF
jgi:hypothetical protein